MFWKAQQRRLVLLNKADEWTHPDGQSTQLIISYYIHEEWQLFFFAEYVASQMMIEVKGNLPSHCGVMTRGHWGERGQ